RSLEPQFAKRTAHELDLVTTTMLARAIVDRLVEAKFLHADADVFQVQRTELGEMLATGQDLLGFERATYFTQLHGYLEQAHYDAWAKRLKSLNWELADAAGPAYTWQAITQLQERADAEGIW